MFLKKIIVILAALAAFTLTSCESIDPEVPAPDNTEAVGHYTLTTTSLSDYSFSYNWHGDMGYFENYVPWYAKVGSDKDNTLGCCEFGVQKGVDSIVFTCWYSYDKCTELGNGFDANGATLIVQYPAVFINNHSCPDNESYYNCSIYFRKTDERGISLIIRGDDWNVQIHYYPDTDGDEDGDIDPSAGDMDQAPSLD